MRVFSVTNRAMQVKKTVITHSYMSMGVHITLHKCYHKPFLHSFLGLLSQYWSLCNYTLFKNAISILFYFSIFFPYESKSVWSQSSSSSSSSLSSSLLSWQPLGQPPVGYAVTRAHCYQATLRYYLHSEKDNERDKKILKNRGRNECIQNHTHSNSKKCVYYGRKSCYIYTYIHI